MIINLGKFDLSLMINLRSSIHPEQSMRRDNPFPVSYNQSVVINQLIHNKEAMINNNHLVVLSQ